MSASLPTHASTVMVGGGAIGASIACHLGTLGVGDIVVPERDRLTSGTTWHAAGRIASGGMSTGTPIWIEPYTRRLCIDPDMPVVEDPATVRHVREESGGMLFGLFEPEGAVRTLGGILGSASFATLPPDWERMTPVLEAAFERCPVMKTAGSARFRCAWSA